jgi:hypothetical protein
VATAIIHLYLQQLHYQSCSSTHRAVNPIKTLNALYTSSSDPVAPPEVGARILLPCAVSIKGRLPMEATVLRRIQGYALRQVLRLLLISIRNVSNVWLKYTTDVCASVGFVVLRGVCPGPVPAPSPPPCDSLDGINPPRDGTVRDQAPVSSSPVPIPCQGMKYGRPRGDGPADILYAWWGKGSVLPPRLSAVI